jgi:phosphate transport system substrate-binding protein
MRVFTQAWTPAAGTPPPPPPRPEADAAKNFQISISTADAVRREHAQPEVKEPRAGASRPATAIAAGAILILVILAALFASRLLTHDSKRAAAIAPSAAPIPAAGSVATTALAVAPAFALCGSSTIGAQLASDLVRGFLSSEQARDVSVTSAVTNEQNVQAALDGRSLRVHIAAHGSASAFTGLRSGNCQIGMAGRRMTPDEAAGLHSLGNMFAPASEHVIGLDGIAVIVNPANAAWSLSVAQLKDVFSGKTNSWRGLANGSAASIDVFAGDEQSDTYDTFKSVVLEKTALAASARRFADGASLSAAVAADPNAIGFVDRPYINDAKALRLSSGGFPLAPSPENIERETYPLTRRLFMYTAASPQNAMVTKFIRFVQSDAGQKIVNQDGFVGTVGSLPTSKSAAPTSVGAADPEYQSLLSSFDQASFNLYFDSGAAALDGKALVDVARLVAVVSSRPNKHVALAGFSDAAEDPENDKRLAEERALAAARAIEAEGIRVKRTVAFGSALPVGDNSTEAGRQQNRRVEIFLAR